MHIEIRSPLLKAHQLAQRVDYIFSYMGIRKLRKFCQIYSTLIWENKNNITFFFSFYSMCRLWRPSSIRANFISNGGLIQRELIQFCHYLLRHIGMYGVSSVASVQLCCRENTWFIIESRSVSEILINQRKKDVGEIVKLSHLGASDASNVTVSLVAEYWRLLYIERLSVLSYMMVQAGGYKFHPTCARCSRCQLPFEEGFFIVLISMHFYAQIQAQKYTCKGMKSGIRIVSII